jgi:hypothetical protein
MIFLLALLPATMITIAGYFVRYLSNRSEGAFRTFGRYLSFWAFTLAGLVILGALFAAIHHHHGMTDWRVMHERVNGPWHEGPRDDGERYEGRSNTDHPRDAQPAPPPATPAAPPAH